MNLSFKQIAYDLQFYMWHLNRVVLFKICSLITWLKFEV